MAEKTPNNEPEKTADIPHPDPILMKQQQLQQQHQQINKRIMELQQQRAITDNMIASLHDQSQQVVGAMSVLNELMPDPIL